jgi:two-component system, response regulator
MADEVEILLVEDDPSDVRLTLRELQSEPMKPHIEVARDGEEALDFLFCRGAHAGRSLQHPPKLILLDLKLPKIDGLEVLRDIKNNPQTRAIPVVVLTSSSEERDLVETYKLGANSYVQKPLNFSKFRETVKSLGLYWLAVNRPPPEKTFSRE